jgi:hypothetical protein
MYPFETEVAERQRRKKRRTCSERMDCRAEVVKKSRQRERQSSRRASGFALGLEDLDGEAGLRENNGCGKPIGP